MPTTMTQSACQILSMTWPASNVQHTCRMHVCVQELLTAESATYSTILYFCSCSANQPAALSFPIRVNACRPRWFEMDA